MYKRVGNSKKSSRFMCLSCGKIIMEGIQRQKQREKYHIKNLYCIYENKNVKTVEIRWCDNFDEIKEKIPKLKREYNY